MRWSVEVKTQFIALLLTTPGGLAKRELKLFVFLVIDC